MGLIDRNLLLGIFVSDRITSRFSGTLSAGRIIGRSFFIRLGLIQFFGKLCLGTFVADRMVGKA